MESYNTQRDLVDNENNPLIVKGIVTTSDTLLPTPPSGVRLKH